MGAGKGACQKLETPAANANRHIEMDGSRISQLQLAAKFGEIGFPGTNQDFTLVVKGTTHESLWSKAAFRHFTEPRKS